MSDAFEGLIGPLLAVEGGYSNNPSDAGGETNWGVTAAVARLHGYKGPMRDMTRADAIEVYRSRYWCSPGYDKVAEISLKIAAELFDTGVNMGPKVAGTFLQRLLNVLNRREADFADVTVDGDIGPASRTALKAFLRKRGADGERVLLRNLNSLQAARYVELAELRPANEAFEYGWLANRVA